LQQRNYPSVLQACVNFKGEHCYSVTGCNGTPTPAPASGNKCNPAKTCNVCKACCQSYIVDGAPCDSCAKQNCQPTPALPTPKPAPPTPAGPTPSPAPPAPNGPKDCSAPGSTTSCVALDTHAYCGKSSDAKADFNDGTGCSCKVSYGISSANH
jgi:hypothetical protein